MSGGVAGLRGNIDSPSIRTYFLARYFARSGKRPAIRGFRFLWFCSLTGGPHGEEGPDTPRNTERRIHRRERCGAAVVVAARAVLRDMADEPCRGRSRDRHDLRRRRQRMVRPGGVEVRRSRRNLDAFKRGACLSGGRRADQGGVESFAEWRRALRWSAAGGSVQERRPGSVLAACQRLAETPDAAGLDPRRRRSDPALSSGASKRRRQNLGRNFGSRRVPHQRWRRDVGAAQSWHAGRLPAGGPELS